MEKPATAAGGVHESLRLCARSFQTRVDGRLIDVCDDARYISSSAYHIVADNAQPQTLNISRPTNEISLTGKLYFGDIQPALELIPVNHSL